ncbi:phosphohistidine phosphatase SixA [Microbacterium sp. W4I4]|uniref:histidine phosphatase family protein n=1 Tax=Microbacterium sp. W4I4 TaxID=3042295 RepID=UPI002782E3F4|nr:histidine phosphatase family protein [Microbacterium sp. W4I4]MDQ0614446.1 phosphohistidine phosphatase SixA [Microbacterium sp. W4I4]
MTGESLPRRLALVRRGETEPMPDGRDRLSAAGRRQVLTVAGRLAYSRWSWIAAAPSEAEVETARTIGIEFPDAPLRECAELGEYSDRAFETLTWLLRAEQGDGILVADERVLGDLIGRLCGIREPGLADGAMVVLRRTGFGWEISRGCSSGLLVVA